MFPSYIKKILTISLCPSLIFNRSKYLFILSHMRSRSSLLSHILGSNPEIFGYSELQKSYLSHWDLFKTRVYLYEEFKENISNKYLLDKLLHNNFQVSHKFSTKAKFIILIREPLSTIKSIIKLGRSRNNSWYNSPKDVLHYYKSRLLNLNSFADLHKGNFFFIDSDDIINNFQSISSDLSNWLALRQTLKSQYSIFTRTGKAGFGDTSVNISSGKIKKTSTHDDINVSKEVLDEANRIYFSCKKDLKYKSVNYHSNDLFVC